MIINVISYPSTPYSAPMSVPDDIALMIIKACRVGTKADKATLSGFYVLNRQYDRVMGACRTEIIEYYTVKLFNENSERTSYFVGGELHREGGLPARMCDGLFEWWYHGKLHRSGDLPAVIDRDYDIEWEEGNTVLEYPPYTIAGMSYTYSWYYHGVLHREGNLPAVISDNGRAQEWYWYGKLHREGDLPAVILDNGQTQGWFQHGLCHREGGKPTIVRNPEIESDSEM